MENFNLSNDILFNKNEIHNRNGKNAIIMFSGGMDSTVALMWALNNYKNVKVITIDYNQPHNIETKIAEKILNLFDVQHQLIKVDLPKEFWGLKNFLTRGQACFMTSIAALDIGHEGADIVLGILKTDFYGDCDREFLDSLASVLDHPNDWDIIGIATPLRAVNNKASVIALGYKFGAPMNASWTCRHPVNDSPCFTCMQCKEREKAKLDFDNDYGVGWNTLCKWQNVLGSPYHPSFENSSKELEILASSFSNVGGLNACYKGWKYLSPDGQLRISSLIKNPNPEMIENYHLGEECMHIRAHGFFDDGEMWEVCICKDGTVAATERIPNLELIEKKLIEEAFG